MTCSAPDCDRGGKLTRGMCSKHYRAWLDGTPADQRPPAPRFARQFNDHVDKTGACWIWTGPTNAKGYGWWSGQGERGLAMNLTDFLLARIAEDEERADFVRGQQAGGWTDPEPWVYSWHDEYDPLCVDPARALAECEAKRRIVERYVELSSTVKAYRSPRWKDAMNEQDKIEWGKAEARCRTAEDDVRLLALPYADHREWREEWRP